MKMASLRKVSRGENLAPGLAPTRTSEGFKARGHFSDETTITCNPPQHMMFEILAHLCSQQSTNVTKFKTQGSSELQAARGAGTQTIQAATTRAQELFWLEQVPHKLILNNAYQLLCFEPVHPVAGFSLAIDPQLQGTEEALSHFYKPGMTSCTNIFYRRKNDAHHHTSLPNP